MGKAVRPIRKQVIASFYKILFFSMAATIVTWGIVLAAFVFYSNQMNPANYYESQIPNIMKYVEQQKEQLLSKGAKQALEQRIPLEGMDYQVLDKHGNLLYGSTSAAYINNEKELLDSLNDNLYMRNNIIRFFPLFDKDGGFIGAIGFRYKLTLASANPGARGIILLVGFLSLICPFVYFYFFSYLIGKRLSKQMEKPFHSLMEGVQKIRNHDLDFQLAEFKTVTELQQLIGAFEDMRKALKKSLLRQWEIEEERKEMVAAIAHDLRTPLTIIHGHVEGLLEGGARDPERLERYLQTIFTSTERAVRLMDQLNTVSIVDHPTFAMEPRYVNMTDFIEDKTNEYRLLCDQKKISFQSSAHFDRSDQMMQIDPHRISQVLDNVMTNSIRYCPQYGEIAWKTTVNQETIIFEITDNGPGFQQKNADRLFTKFYREDESRTGTDGNFGLGLYIAHTIAKKHNGSILMKNRPEGGAYTKVIMRELNQ
ncbi:sensor histidine kinase [Siminovitchia sp. 179-K 8D1 HS]|uniref:sensor histidine kinase n=1 Tax=Siminovitchia sp. 179-K 8D1 HS TaxID=3142385 RepID=UPI00399EEC1E